MQEEQYKKTLYALAALKIQLQLGMRIAKP